MNADEVARATTNEPYLITVAASLKDVRGRLPVLVEVGACDGYHSRFFQGYCGVGQLVHLIFEADPRNAAKIAASPLPTVPNVRFYAAALGDKTGTVDFHLATPEPGGAIGSSSLSPFQPSLTESFPWLHCQETIPVTCYRLDEVVTALSLPVVDLVWMDVQGAERLVFAGMSGCIEKVGHIYTEHDGGYEHSATLDELVAQLNAMGGAWEIELVVPGNALLVNRKWAGL